MSADRLICRVCEQDIRSGDRIADIAWPAPGRYQHWRCTLTGSRPDAPPAPVEPHLPTARERIHAIGADARRVGTMLAQLVTEREFFTLPSAGRLATVDALGHAEKCAAALVRAREGRP